MKLNQAETELMIYNYYPDYKQLTKNLKRVPDSTLEMGIMQLNDNKKLK